MDGRIIERPAILVSKTQDMMFGYGDFDALDRKLATTAAAYRTAGFPEEADDLLLIELDSYRMSREQACYIIRRAMEFTASGFILALCREISGGSPVEWLQSEMARIPLDLEERQRPQK